MIKVSGAYKQEDCTTFQVSEGEMWTKYLGYIIKNKGTKTPWFYRNPELNLVIAAKTKKSLIEKIGKHFNDTVIVY